MGFIIFGSVSSGGGGTVDEDKIKMIQSSYLVTTAFPALDVIDLRTGEGTTGVSTEGGSFANITLPTSASLFNNNGRVNIRRNGVDQIKGTDVIWDSTTTLHFVEQIDIDEVIEVYAPLKYV